MLEREAAWRMELLGKGPRPLPGVKDELDVVLDALREEGFEFRWDSEGRRVQIRVPDGRGGGTLTLHTLSAGPWRPCRSTPNGGLGYGPVWRGCRREYLWPGFPYQSMPRAAIHPDVRHPSSGGPQRTRSGNPHPVSPSTTACQAGQEGR